MLLGTQPLSEDTQPPSEAHDDGSPVRHGTPVRHGSPVGPGSSVGHGGVTGLCGGGVVLAIQGSAVNQDGRSSALTAPNGRDVVGEMYCLGVLLKCVLLKCVLL